MEGKPYGVIVNHIRAKQWNNFLKLRMMDISSELLKLDVEGKLKAMPIEELKKGLCCYVVMLRMMRHQPTLYGRFCKSI